MAYARSRQLRWNVASNPRTKDESTCRTRLARECNAAIDFAHVQWAGRNRAGGRRDGADLLRKILRERFLTCGAWLRAAWLTGGIAMAMLVVLMARFLGEVGRAGTRTGPRVIEAPQLACPVPCIRTAGDEAFAGPAAGLLAALVFIALAFAGVLRPIADGEPLIAAFPEIALPAAHRIVVTPETAFLLGMLALSIVSRGSTFRRRPKADQSSRPRE